MTAGASFTSTLSQDLDCSAVATSVSLPSPLPFSSSLITMPSTDSKFRQHLVNPSVETSLRLAELASHVNLLATLQVCLGKSTQEALLGGVCLTYLPQCCLKSSRLATANCEIMQVA